MSTEASATSERSDRSTEQTGPQDYEPLSSEALQVVWRETSEFKRARRRTIWLAGVGLGLTLVAFIGVPVFQMLVGIDTNSLGAIETWLLTFVITGGIAYLAFYLLGPALEASLKNQFTALHRLGLARDIQQEERSLAENAADGRLDLPSLWIANQRRIDLYHNIATDQATSSFKVGQRVMITGFVVVVLLGGVAAFATNGIASIAASVTGVAGAAMAAFIGATFMRVQSEAAAQLRQFFLQPVENSRLLGAERLLETLEPDERAQAARQVIQAMMQPHMPDDSKAKKTS